MLQEVDEEEDRALQHPDGDQALGVGVVTVDLSGQIGDPALQIGLGDQDAGEVVWIGEFHGLE